jgi:XTP/dITP diphosphohydrolase
MASLTGVPSAERTARFVTVAIARWPDGREVAAYGSVDGRIADAPRGEQGFGYDPVFVADEAGGRTFAELDPAAKHAISHRGRAFRTLAEGLCVLAEVGDC